VFQSHFSQQNKIVVIFSCGFMLFFVSDTDFHLFLFSKENSQIIENIVQIRKSRFPARKCVFIYVFLFEKNAKGERKLCIELFSK
jgi:hypothetical protein